MNAREFTCHKEQLQDFVEGIVNLILQRLDEQSLDKVQRTYSNQVVEEELFELLFPLTSRYSIDADAVAKEFASIQLPSIVQACQIDAQRYITEDPALENIEEVFYASNGFWATVAYRIANALLKQNVPSCLLYTSTSPRDRTRSRMPSSA